MAGLLGAGIGEIRMRHSRTLPKCWWQRRPLGDAKLPLSQHPKECWDVQLPSVGRGNPLLEPVHLQAGQCIGNVILVAWNENSFEEKVVAEAAQDKESD